MHKDLTDVTRAEIEGFIPTLVATLHQEGESLVIAREAIINAFDRKAAELDKASCEG